MTKLPCPTHLRRIWLLANLLLPFSILLFATGFFPYKPFLPGLSSFEEDASIQPVFDKVIFMVVDALRSDFVYAPNSGFKFAQSLIDAGAAVPFTARASAPTITMPRIKALTTGSVPSFLDVILNFAESDTTSSLATQDTWLAQIRAQGAENQSLVMYGDDTWLKLFPGYFNRHDGTSSFFVSDFTQVDNNVTRHVPSELIKDDWSAMILHYLGLDHIGHKTGPLGPHMIPKQREMDSIVKDIYTAIERENHLSSTLLVLCGDHGMNDAGNHGGASPGETSAALMYISPKFKSFYQGNPRASSAGYFGHEIIEQSDVAPTLAALLGFPIPQNSLGVITPSFLSFWKNRSDKLRILLHNAQQLAKIVKATFSAFDIDGSKICEPFSTNDIPSLDCSWANALRASDSYIMSKDHRDYMTAENRLLRFCRQVQSTLSNAASNYNVTNLYVASSIAMIATALAYVASLNTLHLSKAATYVLFFTLMTFNVTMTASSFVEEEQQFWYWISTAWIFYLYAKLHTRSARASYSVLSFAVLFRFIRRWNQTGQKFSGASDIASGFLARHPNVLWALNISTFIDILRRLIRSRHEGPLNQPFIRKMASSILVTLSLIFKLSFTHAEAPELVPDVPFFANLINLAKDIPLVHQAQVIYFDLSLVLVFAIYQHYITPRPVNAAVIKNGRLPPLVSDISSLLTLLLVVQSRASNIPLFLLFSFQRRFLVSFVSSFTLLEISLTSLILQHASFFAFGGSNAISSVDLSNAYNGVSGYNVFVVGVLTFVSNWAGPIYWSFSGIEMILSWSSKHRNQRSLTTSSASALAAHDRLSILTLFFASSTSAVMVACTVLRTHLFIWSVFSPKYLYVMAWVFAQYFIVNVGIGTAIFPALQRMTDIDNRSLSENEDN